VCMNAHMCIVCMHMYMYIFYLILQIHGFKEYIWKVTMVD
jgi:hypothetical protein